MTERDNITIRIINRLINPQWYCSLINPKRLVKFIKPTWYAKFLDPLYYIYNTKRVFRIKDRNKQNLSYLSKK
jgi:hypothetical protein